MDNLVNTVAMANVDLKDSTKEGTWTVPKGCQWFTLQSRGGALIRMALISGNALASQPPYFTIKTDNAWNEGSFRIRFPEGLLLFFACDSAETLEVILGLYDPLKEKEVNDAS